MVCASPGPSLSSARNSASQRLPGFGGFESVDPLGMEVLVGAYSVLGAVLVAPHVLPPGTLSRVTDEGTDEHSEAVRAAQLVVQRQHDFRGPGFFPRHLLLRSQREPGVSSSSPDPQ